MDFGKTRSIIDFITTFSREIQSTFNGGKAVLATFLNISSSFDCVIPSILLGRLEALGVPFFLRRDIYTLIEKKRFLHCLLFKAPWSSNFFTGYISRLRFELSPIPKGTKMYQYADDLALYVSERK